MNFQQAYELETLAKERAAELERIEPIAEKVKAA
jgi:hypothetical protein